MIESESSGRMLSFEANRTQVGSRLRGMLVSLPLNLGCLRVASRQKWCLGFLSPGLKRSGSFLLSLA